MDVFFELEKDDLAVDGGGETAVAEQQPPISTTEVPTVDAQIAATNDGENIQETAEESAIAILAKDLKAQGKLLEDIEINNDFSYDNLVEAAEKTFTKQNKDAVRQEIYQELEQEGITKDVIENVRKANAGVTHDDEKALTQYANLALIDLSKIQEDKRDSELLIWTKYRYMANGLSEQDAELVASKNIDENYDGTIKTNQEFFTAKWQETKANIDKKLEDAKTAKIENAKKSRLETETILDKGEVAGVKFTLDQVKKIKAAFFEPTERINVNGTIYKVTLAQKKEFERQDNKEQQLLDRINLVLGIDPRVQQKKVDEKAKSDAEKRFNSAMQEKGFDGRKNTSTVKETSHGVFMDLT